MENQDFNNLLIAHKIIIETINSQQEISNSFLLNQKITVDNFEKIFDEIEIPLCKIADDIAIVVHQKLFNPVTGYKQEIELICSKIQDTIENSENFQSLITILRKLVDFFDKIINYEDTYPETSKILDGVESICNHY
ncbi:hypothetical protein [Nostoc sp. NMS8]|uniref:hypothetical protein n=1 Tax=Nostoc sp. NMS8 TaxID=2815392 RepID=UPI0025DDD794|nr:hypothetical protein [Nostoc sp. NMS8]MBN3957845.1 hypothetical protein [Nostoc sp. NMS8]